MLDARAARGTRAPQDAHKGLWGSRPGCRVGGSKKPALARPVRKIQRISALLGRALPDLQLLAGHLVVAAPDCVGCDDRIRIPGQGVKHLERLGAFLH